MCFASAGSRVSLTGGTYAYAEVAFGPFIGFVVAMSLWFGSSVLASAAVANVFVDSVAKLVPAAGAPASRAAILLAMFTVFAVINIRGVKLGSGVVQAVTIGKLAPLLILIAVGMFFVNPANLLHDGRATSVEDAILRHDGQGLAARNAFAALPSGHKKNLLAFLAAL